MRIDSPNTIFNPKIKFLQTLEIWCLNFQQQQLSFSPVGGVGYMDHMSP